MAIDAATAHYLEAVASWDHDFVLREQVRREFPHFDPWRQKKMVDQRRDAERG